MLQLSERTQHSINDSIQVRIKDRPIHNQLLHSCHYKEQDDLHVSSLFC